MNKQELLSEIEKQESVAKALKEKLLNKEQQLKLKLLNTFSDIIDVDNHIEIKFYDQLYVDIDLVNVEGKRIFGTTVNLYCRDEGIIELNTETCGSFGIGNVAQIKKYEIVTNFWKNYDKYSKALINAREEIKPYKKEFEDAARNVNKLKYELEQIEREEETQFILLDVKPGDKYEIKARWSTKKDWFKGNDKLTVTKITNKSIFVEYHCNGFVTTDTGRVSIDDFVYYIKNGYLVKENA